MAPNSRKSSSIGAAAGDPAVYQEPLFGAVPLRKRAARFTESSRLGLAINLGDGLLSLFAVLTYVIDTYGIMSNVWLTVNFALSLVFLLEWMFWFWLADSKLRYVVSWRSVIDYVTVGPGIVFFFFTSIPVWFFRVIRLIRLTRVVQLLKMGQKAGSEIVSIAFEMVSTVAIIMFLAASLFYEIETNYGYDGGLAEGELYLHTSVYWAAVTLATIGYGDIHPTIWASQMLFLLLLVVLLAVLPYQTSRLGNVLSQTTVYMRNEYTVSPGVSHVLVMGYITTPAAKNIVRDIFHSDHGYQDIKIVFLCPVPPSSGVRALLSNHTMAHRMLYIQGSPFQFKDLERARCELATSLFIMCNKRSSEPADEDTHNIMLLLSVGQYLIAHSGSPKPPRSLRVGRTVLTGCTRAMGYGEELLEGRVQMYIQLLLPASKYRLNKMMGALAHPVGPRGPAASAGNAQRAHGVHRLMACFVKPRTWRQWNRDAESDQLFWDALCREVRVVCVNELRMSLLSHSALGCPGVMTLFNNLTSSIDSDSVPSSVVSAMPEFVQEYVSGAMMEVYEVQRFPEALVGQPYRWVANFIFVRHRAVLFALGVERRHLYIAPVDQIIGSEDTGYIIAADVIAVIGIAGVESEDFHAWLQEVGEEAPTSDIEAQRGLNGLALSAIHGMDLAPLHDHSDLDLSQRTSDPAGQTLAFNGGIDQEPSQQPRLSQLPPMYSFGKSKSEAALTSLAEHQQIEEMAAPEGLGRDDGFEPGPGAGPEAAHGSGPEARAVELVAQELAVAEQQLQLRSAAGMRLRPAVSADGDIGIGRGTQLRPAVSADGDIGIGRGERLELGPGQRTVRSQPNLVLHSESAPTQHQSAPGRQVVSGGNVSITGFSMASSGNTGTTGSSAGSRGTATSSSPSTGRGARVGWAFTPFSTGSGANVGKAARAVGSMIGGGGSQVSGGGSSTNKAPRKDVMRQAGGHLKHKRNNSHGGLTDGTHEMETKGLTREGKALAEQRLATEYHVYDDVHNIVVQTVEVKGHLLLCGNGMSAEELFAFVLPFRSKKLSSIQPIVVLDRHVPEGDPAWEQVCRLKELYFVQGHVDTAADLVRADAEDARLVVLMPPGPARTFSSGSASGDKAVVMDADTILAVQQLRAVQCSVEIYTEMLAAQNVAFLSPMGPVSAYKLLQYLYPAYMGGFVYLEGLADSIMVQAMYNNIHTLLFPMLLNSWHAQDSTSLLRTLNASVSFTLANLHDGPAAPVPPGASAGVDAEEGPKGPKLMRSQATSAREHQPKPMILQLPVTCVNAATFGQLFGRMMSELGAVPIGLYRYAESSVLGAKGRAYVYTNPTPDTMLRPDDMAFVMMDLRTRRGSLPTEWPGADPYPAGRPGATVPPHDASSGGAAGAPDGSTHSAPPLQHMSEGAAVVPPGALTLPLDKAPSAGSMGGAAAAVGAPPGMSPHPTPVVSRSTSRRVTAERQELASTIEGVSMQLLQVLDAMSEMRSWTAREVGTLRKEVLSVRTHMHLLHGGSGEHE